MAVSPQPPTAVRTVALAAHAAGLCVVPPREDGTKAPAAEWKRYQRERPSATQLDAWYTGERQGVGLVCGSVSGGLELLEFETFAIYVQFRELAVQAGLDEIVTQVEYGYSEQAPRGGVHWLYRCPDAIRGNTKLAQGQNAATGTIETLIETRGEGGYVVIAPSGGSVHPSGRPYTALLGTVESIATISAADRDALWAVARGLDEVPPAAPDPSTSDMLPAPRDRSATTADTERPGDAFARTISWEGILTPKGWARVGSRVVGDAMVTYWRRPGKERGLSASTNIHGSDLFYVFSTSTQFQAERGYSKFSTYGLLYHGGDWHATAKALAEAGYGQPPAATGPTVLMLPTARAEAAAVFPADALPTVAGQFVAEAMQALHCPPEYVAMPLLALVGAVAGNAVELELKPGWVEGCNLYGAVVGAPGTKKSPGLQAALVAVRGLQTRLHNEYAAAQQAYEASLADWERQRKGEERGEKPSSPTYQHIFTTDATVEALAPMLAQSKGICLVRDELVGWVRGMDQYRNGKGADRQHYLSMWSRSLIKVDRKHGEPILVPRPCLSVIGGIQPDMLPELVDAASREDGFVDRLLWAYPAPMGDCWSEESVSPQTIEALRRRYEALYLRPLPTDLGGHSTTGRVSLSGAAHTRWVAWYRAYTAAAEDQPQRLRGAWAKLPSQLARLICICHALGESDLLEVDAETVERAEALLAYFVAQLRRVYQEMGQQSTNLDTRILAILQQHGPLATKELHAKLHGHVNADRVHGALELLVDQGLAECEERPRSDGRAGRGSRVWSLATPQVTT